MYAKIVFIGLMIVFVRTIAAISANSRIGKVTALLLSGSSAVEAIAGKMAAGRVRLAPASPSRRGLEAKLSEIGSYSPRAARCE
jgi:hypothetical protein